MSFKKSDGNSVSVTTGVSATDTLLVSRNNTSEVNEVAAQSLINSLGLLTGSIEVDLSVTKAQPALHLNDTTGGSSRYKTVVDSGQYVVQETSTDGSEKNTALVLNSVAGRLTTSGEILSFEGVFKPRTYTVTTLPSANSVSGGVTFVNNGAAGSPVLAFSDGSNWLRSDTLVEVTVA